MTKLYDVKKGSKIRLREDVQHPPAHRDFNPLELLVFSHIDGMYSLCHDSNGHPVHLAAWSDVEVID